jgi:hypothetical protein
LIKRILLLLALFISNDLLAQDSNWLNNKWTGFVGFEHDTTQYHITFNFQDSLNYYQVKFEQEYCGEYDIKIDSTSQKYARFIAPELSNQTKPCYPSNFVIELFKSDSPNVLYVQYNWWNDELWLGQVKNK